MGYVQLFFFFPQWWAGGTAGDAGEIGESTRAISQRKRGSQLNPDGNGIWNLSLQPITVSFDGASIPSAAHWTGRPKGQISQ